MALRDFGVAACGLEPDPSMVTQLKSARPYLDVRNGVLTDIRGMGRWDVIVMSHVLEHLPDPEGALEILHENLADGGLVWLEVPCDSREKIETMIGHGSTSAHTLFFTHAAMCMLFSRSPLEILEVSESGWPLSQVIGQLHLRHFLQAPRGSHLGGLGAVDPGVLLFAGRRWLAARLGRPRGTAYSSSGLRRPGPRAALRVVATKRGSWGG